MKPCLNFRNGSLRIAIALSVFCMSAAAVHAQFFQYSGGTDNVATYTFSITAKSPQPPLMKYRLYPSYSEQFPGNAVPLYQRAILLISQHSAKLESRNEYWEKIDNWRVLPLEELPIDEVEKVVDSYGGALQEATFAARRAYCDWNLPTREHGVDIFSVMLPEIQEMRTVARLLALRIHLRLAQGRFDEAIADLQTGYAMARHVGNRDFFVNALVGIAIGSIMNEQLLMAISVDSTPNLFWSIVNQPRPLIDIRHSIDVERDSVFTIFPELKEASTNNGDQAYWDRQLLAVINRANSLKSNQAISAFGGNSSELDWNLWAYRSAVISQVPRVKHELVDEFGHPQAEVDAMPGSRAMLLYSRHTFERMRDANLAPLGLPYYQAKRFYPGNDQFSGDFTTGDPLGLAKLLIPAAPQVQQASVREIRWSAMLQTMEAIRDYAAIHGSLPESLDQVDHLPIPNNPFDNQPFTYQWQAETPWEATLVGDSEIVSVRFQFTLRQP